MAASSTPPRRGVSAASPSITPATRSPVRTARTARHVPLWIFTLMLTSRAQKLVEVTVRTAASPPPRPEGEGKGNRCAHGGAPGCRPLRSTDVLVLAVQPHRDDGVPAR